MGILGNYSIINRSPATFRSGSDGSNLRSNYSKSGSLASRFSSLPSFSAIPNGYTHPYSWSMARTSGGLASYKQLSAEIKETKALSALGINIESSLSASFLSLQSILAVIVRLNSSLSASGSFTKSQVAIILALQAAIQSEGLITSAQITKLVCMISNIEASGSISNSITNLVHMASSIGGPTELSPEGLAKAVWAALADDNNSPLTMGNKLNAASSAGDPWLTDLPGPYVDGSAGALLKNIETEVLKRLKKIDFIALK